MTLILSTAIEIFDRKNQDGKIPDRKSGGIRSVKPNQRNVICSHVRRAVAHTVGLDLEDQEAVEAVDIAPYVGILADQAYAAAEEAGLARPANLRSSVESFLDTVLERRHLGYHRSGVERQPAADRVHEAWRPLYDALIAEIRAEEERLGAEGKKLRGGIRGFPSQLVRLQEIAARNGVHRPENLPGYDQVREWCEAGDLSDGQRYGMQNAYRRARELAGAEDLPELMQVVRGRDRGLRGLPQLVDLLAVRGCTTDPREIETVEIIATLAPKMGRAVRERLKRGRARDRSKPWLREQVDATSRALASLIRIRWDAQVDDQDRDPRAEAVFRIAEELEGLTYLDLWERTAEIDAPASGLAGGDQDFIFADLGLDPASRRETQIVSLMRALLDEAAPSSADASCLTYHQREDVDLEALLGLPPYTEKISVDVRNLYGLTRDLYERTMLERGGVHRERWLEIEREYQRIRDHIDAHNQHFRVRGQIDKTLHIYWPHAILLGVGALRQRAYAAFAALDRYRERHGAVNTETSSALEMDADSGVRDYIVYAVLLDDGLRRKNYAGAIMNEHLIPDVIRDKQGRWVGFRGVETVWRGYDHDDVALKQDEDERGAERIRRRDLTPAIVDMRLMFRYWTETRPRDLVRRQLIGDVAEYSPEEDRYAWYIGRRPEPNKTYQAHEKNERRVQAGAVTADSLGNTFARIDYWVITEVLGHDLPEWGSDELRQKYRSILGPHGSRTQIANYFGGLRDNWPLAKELTNDTKDTLKKHYLAIRGEIQRDLRLSGWRNPRYWDDVIDRMLEIREGEDWHAFWGGFDRSMTSDELLRLLDAPKEEVAPKKTRKRRRQPA